MASNPTRLSLAAAGAAVILASFFTVMAGTNPAEREAKKMAPAAKTATLYSRLGGKKGITMVVGDFITNCAGDSRINRFFAATAADPKRLAMFQNNLIDQICEASGGPCKYKGKDMKSAHMGMGVSGKDFDALVQDLVSALDKNKVGATEKGELLGVLGPMKPDIVEKK